MKPTLTLLPSTHPARTPEPDGVSPHVLAELLALNEEMIEQLCLERVAIAGTADFLTKIINQHEKTAALLRIELASEPPVHPEIKAAATRLYRTG